MGNTEIVYEEGKYIVPNKILRKKDALDGKKIDMDNIFGKIDIPSARAQINQQVDLLEISTAQYAKYYDRDEESFHQPKDNVKKKKVKVLSQVHNIVDVNIPASLEFHKRERKTKIDVPVCHRSDTGGTENYITRKDSPIKNENKSLAESQAQIFESRHQSHYFNFEQ